MNYDDYDDETEERWPRPPFDQKGRIFGTARLIEPAGRPIGQRMVQAWVKRRGNKFLTPTEWNIVMGQPAEKEEVTLDCLYLRGCVPALGLVMFIRRGHDYYGFGKGYTTYRSVHNSNIPLSGTGSGTLDFGVGGIHTVTVTATYYKVPRTYFAATSPPLGVDNHATSTVFFDNIGGVSLIHLTTASVIP